MDNRIVLSVCDLTGKMLLPWAEAGHECLAVDIQHPAGETVHPLNARIKAVGMDILSPDFGRLVDSLRGRVAAMFSFPPCTDLTGSGARWWAAKGPEAYRDAMRLFLMCVAAGERLGCPWFAENPPGRVTTGSHGGEFTGMMFRQWDHRFQPWEYGGWDGHGEAFWESGGRESWERFAAVFSGPEAAVAGRWTEWCRGEGAMPVEPNDGYHKLTCLWCGGGFRMPERRPIPLNSRPDWVHRSPDSRGRANRRSATPMGFARAVFAFQSTPPFGGDTPSRGPTRV